MSFRPYIISMILATIPISAYAIDNIKVLGLFDDKALIVVDHEEYLLDVGDKSPEGVRLLKVENDDAWLEVDGNRMRFDIEPSDDYLVAAANSVTLVIEPDERGLYLVNGYINGQWVTFIIDTGSSHTAISSKLAKRLGLDYENEGVTVQIDTASGREPGHAMRLREVKVGDIKVHDVAALIIHGDLPHTPLLGMSFLEQLQLRNEGRNLHVTQVRKLKQ